MKPGNRRILITGASGQVGGELVKSLATAGEIWAPARTDLDLSNPEALSAAIADFRPHWVINPAAYTAVDRAETDVEHAEAINAVAPGVIARACAAIGARLVHFSTDYVFDGRSAKPYAVSDPVAPQSVYGRTKLEGERAVMAAGADSLILRTAWVYGSHGKNFLLTMLRLANERPLLRVVADQVGTPTSSTQIAQVTAQLLLGHADARAWPRPLAHLTCLGQTSWHGFSSAIVAKGAALGLCPLVPVQAISSSEYPTPAQRPAMSALDTSETAAMGGTLVPWEAALDQVLAELSSQRSSGKAP